MAAPLLSFIGIHMVARDRVLETYALTQGVSFSFLLLQTALYTIGLNLFVGLSYLYGVFAIALIALVLKYLLRFFHRQKSSFYFMGGLSFMGFSYALVSFFPFLESHLSRTFMGDLVTASSSQSVLVAMLFIPLLLVCFNLRFLWRRDTLNLALFGREAQLAKNSKLSFDIVSLVTLSVSILTLGHLYTLALTLMAPLIINALSRLSFNSFVLSCLGIGLMSSLLGLLFSLLWPGLSTVPLILVILVLTSTTFGAVSRIFST